MIIWYDEIMLMQSCFSQKLVLTKDSCQAASVRWKHYSDSAGQERGVWFHNIVVTDGQTDGRTDGWMDAGCWVTWTTSVNL